MVVENHGNVIDRVSFLIRPRELQVSPTSSYLAANQEEHGEAHDEISLQGIFTHTSK
jgi:hypothetical protein